MTATLFEEAHRNATEGYLLAEPETVRIDSTVLDGMSYGEMFRWFRNEYGRCTGKVYVGDGIHVGWIFAKRDKYEDTGETFLHETWITLLDRDETVRNTDYHAIR